MRISLRRFTFNFGSNEYGEIICVVIIKLQALESDVLKIKAKV